MRSTVLLLALASAFTFAADNAAVAPQTAASHKPQATSYGTEAITIPQMLSYQGKLTDTLGVPVGDTLYAVRFRLYAVPSGGTEFWEETQDVRTRGGLFGVLLGAVTPIGSVPDGGELYLGMAVAGGAELAPRLRLASAAYTYLTARAADSDRLQGKDTTSFVRTGQANSVTSAMITNGTIAAADLGQMGASSGQVVKWTGSAWEARNDSVGQNSGGTVRKVVQATGIVCSPNPISDSGTVGFDLAWGNGQYVNAAGDSMYGALVVSSGVRALRGTFGTDCSNGYNNTLVAGQGCKVFNDFCTVAGGYYNQAAEPGQDDSCATVCGGYYNFNGGKFAFIGGGRKNGCSYPRGVVCGGDSNRVLGSAGVVCGGIGNSAAQYSLVGGGVNNGAAGSYAVVVGGYQSHADEYSSAVVGGEQCLAASRHSFVGGGYGDTTNAVFGGVMSGNSNLAGDAADDTATVVAGGWNNSATGKFNFIGGGYQNNSSNNYSVVLGGRGNTANGPQASVGGGWGNTASGWHSVVAGGLDNTASGTAATVSGGEDNVASGYWSNVGGGRNDTASAPYGVVVGGYDNRAGGATDDSAATVVGGRLNQALAKCSFIGGGRLNQVGDLYSAVCGGDSNRVSSYEAFIGGGAHNLASGQASVIAGGQYNSASSTNASVGGGSNNAATNNQATVSGGDHNSASGANSTVTGGYYGSVSGTYSTVIGGANDTCAANYALVAGSSVRARSGAQYTFAFGEGCTTSVPRAVIFYHSGAATKLGVGVQTPTHYIDVTGGSYCDATGWHNPSSRELKRDIAKLTPAECQAILRQLMATDVARYKYKLDEDGREHIGLIAEEAPEVLTGPDRKAIGTGDAIGFLLAAVKAQQAEIEQMKAELKRR